MVAWLVFACWLKMETLILLIELFMVLLTEFDSDEMLLEGICNYICSHFELHISINTYPPSLIKYLGKN